jgi:hypothetical protein
MSIALHRVGMFIYIYNFRSHKDTLLVEVFFPWFVKNGYQTDKSNSDQKYLPIVRLNIEICVY